ncbi:S9 family peptidase [Acidiplasma sp.]|uniref:alpha/beta hydrolase family protein n=1 Tax=Acidiplasma sp. TaxID=1872114 RepID=UPI00316783ED
MEDYSIERLLKYRFISNVRISPNGDEIACIATKSYREYKKKNPESTLFIFKKNMEIKRKIDGHGIKSFEYASSGRSLYVCGNNIIVLDNNGMDISLNFPGEIDTAKWYDDSRIIFTAKEKKVNGEDDAYFFEDSDSFNSLYIIDMNSGIKKITEKLNIWEFSVDGKNIYAIASECPQESCWYASKVYKIGIDRDIKIIYDPEYRQIGKIRAFNDNVAFLESVMSDRGVVSGDIILISGNKTKNLTEDSDSSYSHIEFFNNNIYAMENHMSEFRIKNIDTGSILWRGTGIVYPVVSPEFSISLNKIALVFSDTENPGELLFINGDEIIKSEINKELRNSPKYANELIEWDSNGMRIYGFLRSLGPEKPLIVYIHGGPTSFSYPAMIDRTTMYLDNGYSVFLPNYRGSIGLGRKYAESNLGDLGGNDFEDIINGINFLKSTGKIKTDRIYITGGSYGGYMSALAVAKSNIFRASVSLYGISDWVSFHGTSNLHLWDQIHMHEDPYKFNKYDKFSVIRMNSDIKTPILLMHGIEDPYVPYGQYLEFYRYLKDKNKKVRLLLFPREGHGFGEKMHMIQQYRETLKFFDENI